ncbi:MAG TPA: N-acetylmuramoyl-L-alanine amidase [Thermoanaerobaculia bacterium]|nr:N-acetylmuramoyl-L-alanine amidase [Thermoanaerobaculia bacterium]
MLHLLAVSAIAWQLHQPPSQAAAVDAGDRFEAVGISWSSASSLPVRVRASGDGGPWTEWTTLALDGDLTDASEGRYASAITHFGTPYRHLQYAFSGPVDRVTLTFFPPPERRLAASEAGFRSRVDWGCPDGEGSRWTPAYTNVTHAVVHHTAGSNELIDWEAEVRSIWYYHTFTNGWGDIGYNYLIDPNGVVYEGRAGGDGAIGAHFSCRNSNTAGIALLGTFTNVAPADAALQSLKRLLAEICAKHSIDPTAILFHPSSGLNLPTILGHRDGNVPGATCTITECPGDAVYSMLPAIRTELACRPVIDAGPKPATIHAGDSVTLSITARGSEPMTYQWFSGQTPIEGATAATMTITPTSTASYFVRISNTCGTIDSAEATVSVESRVRRRAAGRG